MGMADGGERPRAGLARRYGFRYRLPTEGPDVLRDFVLPLLADAYAACALIGVLALVLPHPAVVREVQGWVLVSCALGASAVLRLGRRRIPADLNLLTTMAVGFSLCAVWVGGPGLGGVALSAFFGLVAVGLFAFMSWRLMLLYVVITGIGYGVILEFQDVEGWPALVGVLVGVVLSLSVVANSLVGRISTLAMEDELTGIENRRAWYRQVQSEMGRVKRGSSTFTVMLIDLDDFKRINDERGHEAGDRHLCDVTAAWTDVLRPDDHLARWGGDEFAVLLPGCGVGTTGQVLDRLHMVMPHPHTFSSGVAEWDRMESVDELMHRADQDLYKAKRDRDRSLP